MKNQQGFALLTGLLVSLGCYGDTVLSVQNQDLSLGATTITAPLLLTGYQDASAIQFTVQWNASVLSYSSLGSFNSNFLLLDGTNADGYVYINTAQASQGLLMVAYDNPLGSDFSVPDGSVLFSISFDVLGSPGASSKIEFTDSPTARKLVSVSSGVLAFATSGGTISLEAPDPGNTPTISLNGNANVTHEAGTVYVDPGANASDPEDGELTNQIVVSGTVDVNQLGGQTITYSVTDSSGKGTSVDRVITVVDTIAPVLSLNGAANVTHEVGQIYQDAGATSVDSFEGNVNVHSTGTVNVNVPGQYIISYSAKDSSNNESTATRIVVVADTLGPIITLAGDAVLNHEAGIPFSEPGAFAQDAFDGPVNVLVTGFVDPNQIGTYELSYDAIDQRGNSAVTVKRTVHVVDTTKPVISILGEMVFTVEAGSFFSNPSATVEDFEQGLVPVITGSVDTSVLGVYELAYDVSDSSGNSAVSVKITVTIQDTIAPTITINGNARVTQEVGLPYQDAGATAIDSFEGNVNIDISGVVDINKLGQYSITYFAKDSSNNESTATRVITIVDTVAPIITLSGAAILNHEAGTPFNDPGATANDAFDGPVSVTYAGSVDIAQLGTYEIIYDATDLSGNPAETKTRQVNVVDTTAPIIAFTGGGAQMIHEATTPFTASASATDSFEGVIQVETSGQVNINVLGTYQLNYDAADSSGNQAVTALRTVEVVDTTPPVITLGGLTRVIVLVGTTFNDAGATATDTLDTSVDVVVDGNVNVDLAGIYTLTYRAADDSGNNATPLTRVIEVVDDLTPPVITILGNVVLSHEAGQDYIDAGAMANDNRDGDISSQIQVTGTVNVFQPGTYEIHYNVSDIAGNQAAEKVRTVKVVDTISPVLTLNGAEQMDHEAGIAFTDPGASAVDNLDGDITFRISVTGNVNTQSIGSYTLLYDVADNAGNPSSSLTREVQVFDRTKPLLTLIGDASITHEAGTPFSDPGARAEDSFEGDLSSSIGVQTTVNDAKPGSYQITYNVSDSSGNKADELIRDITVVDTVAPQIILLGEANITHEAGRPFSDPGATAQDSVDGNLTDSIKVAGEVVEQVPGRYSLIYSVADQSGNQSLTRTRVVQVEDNLPPTIRLLGSEHVVHFVGSNYTDLGAEAEDLAEGSVPVQVTGSVNSQALGTYIITYSAVDQSGNRSATLTRTVTVSDGLSVGDLILTSTDLLENGDSVKAILFFKELSLAEEVPLFVESDLPGRVNVEGPSNIVQGSKKVEFIISGVDDSTVNGNQPVSFRIHNGYRDLASINLRLIDDDVPETIRGTVADGLISNATVFFDSNGNQTLDDGEPYTITDKVGKFHLHLPVSVFDQNGDGRVDSKDGFIISLGGIDTATGVSIDYPLSAPPAAAVINPVTSIVATVLQANQNLDDNAASALVKKALMIKSNIDVLNFDMFSEANKGNTESIGVIKSTAKLQDTIVLGSILIHGGEGSGLDTSSITQAMVQKVINGEQLNLDDPNSVGQIIDSAAKRSNKQISADYVNKVSSVIALQNELKESTTLSGKSAAQVALEISRIQSFAQSESRSDVESLTAGKTTVDDLDVKYDRENLLGLVSSTAAGPILGIDARAGTFQFNAPQFEVIETGEIISSIKITRSEGNLGKVKVLVTPEQVTALVGQDFIDQKISLTFEDQELFKVVDVGQWILNDALSETSEEMEIILTIENSNAADARIGDQASARGLILDDDSVGAFQFSTPQSSFNENTTSEPSVVVERVNGSRGQVKVTFMVTKLPGGAELGQDFEFSTSEIIFGDGVLKRRLYFTMLDDLLLEPTEHFGLEITSVDGEFSGASIAENKSTLIHILSDEINLPPTISVLDDQVIEEGRALVGVPFFVFDDFTHLVDLRVTGQSSDSTLLKNEDIVLVPGPNIGEWFLSATPILDRAGDTTITIAVYDGQLQSTTSFLLVVNNVNNAPSMSQLPKEITAIGQAVTLPLQISDMDTPIEEVFVSIQANLNANLTQDKIRVTGSGGNWQIVLNENGTAIGTGHYTLTVTDSGGAQTSQNFRVYFSEPGMIPDKPALNFTIGSNNTLILTWEGDWQLFQSNELIADFRPINNAQSPYVINMEESGFFMLKGE